MSCMMIEFEVYCVGGCLVETCANGPCYDKDHVHGCDGGGCVMLVVD